MDELKFYIQAPKPSVSHLGTQIFMGLSWMIIGGLILLVYRDAFFLISFLLISAGWVGLVWWHRQQTHQLFIALNAHGILVKVSALSPLEFLWHDIARIRLTDDTMTLRLKSSDEYDIHLTPLSHEQRRQWHSALKTLTTQHGVELIA